MIFSRTVLHVLIAVSGTVLCTRLSAQNLAERVHFVDAAMGSDLITERDEYTDRWSWFDVQVRLGRNGHPRELLEFAGEQTRDWTEEEKGRIAHIVNSLTVNIASRGFRLSFPDSILFVKSTCREEGGAAGYTRRNFIVLKEGFLNAPYNQTRKLVAHELFHVLSRNDSLMRSRLYALVGFEMCGELQLTGTLNRRRITNPDAPINNAYIEVQAAGDTVQCAMLIYSDRIYDGGGLFNYMNIGLLQVRCTSDSLAVAYDNGEPVLHRLEGVHGFYEQVGSNTRYVIHPEEILADNFVYAVQGVKGVPTPRIVEGISRILSGRP